MWPLQLLRPLGLKHLLQVQHSSLVATFTLISKLFIYLPPNICKKPRIPRDKYDGVIPPYFTNPAQPGILYFTETKKPDRFLYQARPSRPSKVYENGGWSTLVKPSGASSVSRSYNMTRSKKKQRRGWNGGPFNLTTTRTHEYQFRLKHFACWIKERWE